MNSVQWRTASVDGGTVGDGWGSVVDRRGISVACVIVSQRGQRLQSPRNICIDVRDDVYVLIDIVSGYEVIM